MRFELVVLQVIAVIIVVLITIVAESSLWRTRILPGLRRVVHPDQEEPKDTGAAMAPWYWQNPVETGVLEVALAFTAAAMALPAFTAPHKGTPAILVWTFEGVLLIAAVLAAACSLWLFRIYVRQLMLGTGSGKSQGAAGVSRGNVFSVRDAGPYSLLAYAMILLLVGLGMLPLIVVS